MQENLIPLDCQNHNVLLGPLYPDISRKSVWKAYPSMVIEFQGNVTERVYATESLSSYSESLPLCLGRVTLGWAGMGWAFETAKQRLAATGRPAYFVGGVEPLDMAILYYHMLLDSAASCAYHWSNLFTMVLPPRLHPEPEALAQMIYN